MLMRFLAEVDVRLFRVVLRGKSNCDGACLQNS